MKFSRYNGIAVFIVVLVWGAVLRFEQLDRQSFWIDEAVLVLQSQGICKTGFPLMPDNHVDWNSCVVTYLIAPGHFLFRNIHVAGRFASAVAGLIGVGISFFLARVMTGSLLAGVLCACLSAFSTTDIAWSRQAEPYVFVQLFFLLTIFSAAVHNQSRKFGFYALSLVSAVLCAGCHPGGYIAVAFFASYTGLLCLQWATNKWKQPGADSNMHVCGWARNRGKYIWVSAGALLFLIILYRFPLNHSDPREVLATLSNPYNTNYVWQYLALIFKDMGFFSLFVMVVGIVVLLKANWLITLPLIFSTGVYFFLISKVIWTYGERYVTPFDPVRSLLLGTGMALVASRLFQLPGIRRQGGVIVRIPVVTLVCIGCCFQLNLRFTPGNEYWLGFTAPQPDWRQAFEFVEKDSRESGLPLSTITPYPLMHDIYIGGTAGKKYYVPISFGGHPDGVSWSAGHTLSETLRSLEDFRKVEGYILLDEMALRMFGVNEIKEYLGKKTPYKIIPGRFKIYIWRQEVIQ